jgi:hypothetical protein
MLRLILVVSCLCLVPGLAAAQPDAGRPNILFIYTDDQSHRTVSCYPEAYEWAKTPNIDRLAKQGVRFAHAYIGTWCMPSRAALLTGHHPTGVESMRMEGQYPGSTYDPKKCPFWPPVPQERLRHRPDRQVAHRHRHRLRPRLGLSDRVESPRASGQRHELLLRSIALHQRR